MLIISRRLRSETFYRLLSFRLRLVGLDGSKDCPPWPLLRTIPHGRPDKVAGIRTTEKVSIAFHPPSR